jgi:hypothetical protein
MASATRTVISPPPPPRTTESTEASDREKKNFKNFVIIAGAVVLGSAIALAAYDKWANQDLDADNKMLSTLRMQKEQERTIGDSLRKDRIDLDYLSQLNNRPASQPSQQPAQPYIIQQQPQQQPQQQVQQQPQQFKIDCNCLPPAQPQVEYHDRERRQVYVIRPPPPPRILVPRYYAGPYAGPYVAPRRGFTLVTPFFGLHIDHTKKERHKAKEEKEVKKDAKQPKQNTDLTASATVNTTPHHSLPVRILLGIKHGTENALHVTVHAVKRVAYDATHFTLRPVPKKEKPAVQPAQPKEQAPKAAVADGKWHSFSNTSQTGSNQQATQPKTVGQ